MGGFSVNEFHPSSTSLIKVNEFINEMHLPPAKSNERRVVSRQLAGEGTAWTTES